jgi:hypothetical protein
VGGPEGKLEKRICTPCTVSRVFSLFLTRPAHEVVDVVTDVVRLEVVVVSDGLSAVVDVVLLSVASEVVEVVERVVVVVVVVVVASVVELVGGMTIEVDDSEVLVGDDEVLWHGEVSLFFRLCAKEISAEKLTSSSSLSKHRLHWWSCSPVEQRLAYLTCKWGQGRGEDQSQSGAFPRIFPIAPYPITVTSA